MQDVPYGITAVVSGVNGVGFGKTMLVLIYLLVRKQLIGLWRQANKE